MHVQQLHSIAQPAIDNKAYPLGESAADLLGPRPPSLGLLLSDGGAKLAEAFGWSHWCC